MSAPVARLCRRRISSIWKTLKVSANFPDAANAFHFHQASQPGLASDEQFFKRLRRGDAPLGGELLRLPHQRAVGGLRIVVVVDLILRRHRIGRRIRVVVIVGQAAGVRDAASREPRR